MTTFSDAEALADAAQTALPDGTVVTLDGDTANAHCGQGHPIVLLQPPTTTWETGTVAQHSWTVIVVSSHPTTVPAWLELDDLTNALRDPLDVDEARPAQFQPPHGPPWPAMQLTLTTNTID